MNDEIFPAYFSLQKIVKGTTQASQQNLHHVILCMPHEKVFLRCGMVLSILPDVRSHCLVTQDKSVVC